MKKLALLGGTSWHSSLDYYRYINLGVNQRLGGVASADLILRSVNFELYHRYQKLGQWDDIARLFSQDAKAMKSMGAEGVVICANTMHRVAEAVEADSGLPVLHIADALKRSAKCGDKLGVLGTVFTMEQSFYRQALKQRGLTMLVPEQQARAEVNRIIFEELVAGYVNPSSKSFYLEQIEQLKQSGADMVVLGCTEIGMLVEQADTEVALIDSLQSHVNYIIDWCLD